MEVLFLMFLVMGVAFLMRGFWGFFFAHPGNSDAEERLARMEARMEEMSQEMYELRDQVSTLLIDMDDDMAFRHLEDQLDSEQEERIRRKLRPRQR